MPQRSRVIVRQGVDNDLEDVMRRRKDSNLASVKFIRTGRITPTAPLGFVSRVMSLLFNTLSRFVIAFLPRSKRLLISRLQSPSAVILEPKKRKSVTTFTFFPLHLP